MYALAWLYAPSSDDHSGGRPDVSEAEKERQRIMSEFYQAEGLEDPNETFEIEEDDELSTIGMSDERGRSRSVRHSDKGAVEMQDYKRVS